MPFSAFWGQKWLKMAKTANMWIWPNIVMSYTVGTEISCWVQALNNFSKFFPFQHFWGKKWLKMAKILILGCHESNFLLLFLHVLYQSCTSDYLFVSELQLWCLLYQSSNSDVLNWSWARCGARYYLNFSWARSLKCPSVRPSVRPYTWFEVPIWISMLLGSVWSYF